MHVKSGTQISVAGRMRDIWVQIVVLLVADLIVVTLSFILAYFARKNTVYLPVLANDLPELLSFWPVLLLWPLMMWREELYPGFQWVGANYLRRILVASSMASVAVMGLTFVTKTGPQFSRSLLVGFWLVTLITLPIARFAVKRGLDHFELGGPKSVLLGAGQSGSLMLRGLRAQTPPSFRPVAIFDDDPQRHGDIIEGIRVIGPISAAIDWGRSRGIHVAIVAMPGVEQSRLMEIIEEMSRGFPRLLIVPNLFGLSTAEVETRDVSGTLALEMRKNLLYLRNLGLKRLTDLLLGIFVGLLGLPLVGILAAAIFVESGRPIFYQQARVGRGGEIFQMWKFRTMIPGADEVLEEQFKKQPGLRKEWEKRQKLTQDPRLTRVGRVLRRLSLDELPQILNILQGDMSLVGPRPMTADQIEQYGDAFRLYAQVRPGLTGLWQVSGRASTSFQERVEHDMYYVRNWSIWLDLIIIARTVWAVLSGRGAY